MKYDASWQEEFKKSQGRRFKIYGRYIPPYGSRGGNRPAFEEYIGSYPIFKTLEEGLKWIGIVLDPTSPVDTVLWTC